MRSQEQGARCIISFLRDFSLTQIPTRFHYIASGPRLLAAVQGCCKFSSPGAMQLQGLERVHIRSVGRWTSDDGGCHWPTSVKGLQKKSGVQNNWTDVTRRPSSAVLHRQGVSGRNYGAVSTKRPSLWGICREASSALQIESRTREIILESKSTSRHSTSHHHQPMTHAD